MEEYAENNEQETSWWKQNSSRFLIIGGIGLIGLLCCCSFAIFTFSSIFSAMRTSEPYQNSMGILVEHPEAIEALGEPIDDAFFFTGNISTEGNGSGAADYSIPVSGPKGSGTMVVRAVRENDIWYAQEVTLYVDGRADSINLLEE